MRVAFTLDSAADVLSNLDGLQSLLAAGVLDGVSVTGASSQTIEVSRAQYLKDPGVISLLSGAAKVMAAPAAKDFAGADDHVLRQTGQAGHFDSVALVGAAGFDAPEEHDLIACFVYRDVDVSYPGK